MKDYEIKKSIAGVTQMLNRKGPAGIYEGSISVKNSDRVYLTPSGRSKGLLAEGRIVITDLEGNLPEGQLKPTSKTSMHTRCYEFCPDINAVVHYHAPYATTYTQANIPVEGKVSPEFILLFDEVPIVPYGTPGTFSIVAGLKDVIKDYDAVFSANHDVLAVGATSLEAFSETMSLEMPLQTEFTRKVTAGDKNTDLSEEGCKALIKKGRANHGIQNK